MVRPLSGNDLLWISVYFGLVLTLFWSLIVILFVLMPFDVFLKHILKFFFFIFNSDETMGAELGVNKGTSQVVINWSLLCSSLFFHLHSPPDGFFFFFFFQNQDNVFWNAFKWNPPSETSLCPHASRKVCFWHVPLRKLSAELKWKNCLCF